MLASSGGVPMVRSRGRRWGGGPGITIVTSVPFGDAPDRVGGMCGHGPFFGAWRLTGGHTVAPATAGWRWGDTRSLTGLGVGRVRRNALAPRSFGRNRVPTGTPSPRSVGFTRGAFGA